MESLIDVIVLGVSHRTAPVAVREKLTVADEQIEPALRSWWRCRASARRRCCPPATGSRSTRVAADARRRCARWARDLARAGRRSPRPSSSPTSTCARDAEAVHHLFRVASSLDSLVVGEPQILGQVKTTHDAALRAGTARADPEPVLFARLPGGAPGAARDRDRAQPGVGQLGGDRSGAPGVRRLRGAARADRRRRQDVGPGGARAARAGRRADRDQPDARRAPRSWPRAWAAARTRARIWSARWRRADIVLASTGAREPVLTRALVAQGAEAAPRPPAVPDRHRRAARRRAGVRRARGVYLADIDDLQKVAAEPPRRAARRGRAGRGASSSRSWPASSRASAAARSARPSRALRARVLSLAKAEAEKLVAGDAPPGRARPARDPRLRRERRQEAAARAADGAEEGRPRARACRW